MIPRLAKQLLLFVAPLAVLFLSPALNAVEVEDLQAEIDSILSRSNVSGFNWSIYIENDYRTTSYYTRNPTAAMRPASVTKLFTSGAAFGLLGPDHRFETHIHFNGSFSGGVLAGDLILVSEHDFTWSSHYYTNSRTPLNQIVSQLRGLGLTAVHGNVIARGYPMIDDALDRPGVASALRQALLDQGVAVTGTSRGETGFNAPGNRVYTRQSLPLRQAAIRLNQRSINNFADALLLHIGYRLSGSSTVSAGEAQVRNWLESIGIDTTGFQMRDGSGLLWVNGDTQISAVQSLELLSYMRRSFPDFEATLARGCVGPGTLGSRFCGTDAAGRVWGKTGTLPNGQTASLTGYVKNPHDGEVYHFSLIANQATSISAARAVIDDIVVLFAGPEIPNAGPLPSNEVIVDNPDPGALFPGAWNTGAFNGGFRYDYRWAHAEPSITTAATFRPNLPETGLYNVYLWFNSGSNRASDVRVDISHDEGVETVTVDQSTGGGEWFLVGENLPFPSGKDGFARIFNRSGESNRVVIADAVRFELTALLPQPIPVAPRVHYTFNEASGTAPDRTLPAAGDGEFAGGSARTINSPGANGSRSLDTTSSRGHLNVPDAAALDGLERFTLSAWVNLRSTPSHSNRLIARQSSATSDWPGFSWAVNRPNSGTLSADNFTVNLFVGGEFGFRGTAATDDLGADGQWAFVAVSYDGEQEGNNTAFYTGGVDTPARLLGDRVRIGAGKAKSPPVDLRVAGTAATATNTAPNAWFDDVRIYDVILSGAQIEQIRREALEADASGFGEWQNRYFDGAGADAPEAAAPESTPAGDGVPNLLKYALDLGHPEEFARNRLPRLVADPETDGLIFSFNRLDHLPDLRLVVEASSNLKEWEEAQPANIESNGDGTSALTYAGETGEPRRFFRVRAIED